MRHSGVDALKALWQHVRVKGACPTGKVAHPSMLRADDAAEKLNAKPVRYGPRVPCKSYYCRHCGGWHVGRAPQDWAVHLERKEGVR